MYIFNYHIIVKNITKKQAEKSEVMLHIYKN